MKTKKSQLLAGIIYQLFKIIRKDIRKSQIREPKDFPLGLVLVLLMQSLLQK